MTIVLIHHHSPQGHAALLAAQNRCLERNDLLLVLSARSGSNAPGADELENQAFVDQVQADLSQDVQWRAELIEPGEDPTEAIIERIRTIRPDEVVLGTRHRSSLGKMFLGHTVNRFLLEIEFPILLVKPTHD